MPARVQVFIASSLDGFIAGPADELDWLPTHAEVEDTFTPFLAGIGALLMGRRTFEVVQAMEGPWPYGDVPVLVASHRELSSPPPTVRRVQGDIAELVAEAKRTAGEKDVYLDGGQMIREALDGGLIDEITLTVIPTVLGRGIPLFAGAARRHALELIDQRHIGLGLVQLRYRPR